MCRGWFVKSTSERKHGIDLPAPHVGHGFQAVRLSNNERSRATFRSPGNQSIPQPTWKVREHIAAIFLGPEKYLVAAKPLHLEKCHVGNPKPGVNHGPDEAASRQRGISPGQ